MEYNKYIYNSSVVLNADWACTINCPWCDFAVKERKETNKLSLLELKKRIDFASENLWEWSSLILLPWNIIFEYSNIEIQEIFEYACSKWKVVQWELEKVDIRILDVLKLESVKEKVKKGKMFLNIWYVDWNIDLLSEVYSVVFALWRDNIKNQLIENNLLEEFNNFPDDLKMDKLYEYREKWLIFDEFKGIQFNIHFSSSKDIYLFFEKIWFTPNIENIDKISKEWWNIYFDSIESWIVITLHSTMNQKIDKNWNNIWDEEHLIWEEKCSLLSNEFEWSIWWDKYWTIIPHVNPCINKINFWNLQSSKEDIERAFLEHRFKIEKILTKYKYTNWFDQSLLCKKCLDWENPDIVLKDIIKYNIRFENQDIDKTNIGEIEILKYIIKEEYLAYKRKISSILFK